MAEGGVAPPPPKRPTIIRQQNDVTPKVPARPAPPVPGGRPPPPGSISRPPPKPPHVPSKESDEKEEEIDPPLRRPPRKPERPVSSAPKPGSSVKKRPEITIVAARPMSEVGFRGDAKNSISLDPPQKPETEKEHSPKTSPKSVRKPPSRPVSGPALPPVPPRTDIPQEKPTHEPSKPKLPSPLLPDKIPPVIEESQTKAPPPKPAARFPPPRLPPPKTESSGDSNNAPKSPFLNRPLPRPPGKDKELPPHTEVSSDNDKKETGGKVRPPVPRPATRNKPTNDSSQPVVNKQPPPVPSVGPKPVVAAPPVEEQEDLTKQEIAPIGSADTYAQIVKPSKPTIIRPNRNSFSKGAPPKNKSDTPQDGGGEEEEEIKLPPPLPDRKYDVDKEVPNEDQTGGSVLSKTNYNENLSNKRENESSNEVGKSASFSIKDRLKKFDTTKSDNSDEVSENVKKSIGKPPPVAKKPKPTILRKPKPIQDSAIIQESTGQSSAEVVKQKGDDDAGKLESDKVTMETQDKPTAKSEVAATRKPTVIRPPAKPKRTNLQDGTVENDHSEDMKISRTFLDDTEIDRKSRPQPPLPSKQPVPAKIATGGEKEEEDEESNAVVARTKPKPIARARPMSMQVLSTTNKNKGEDGIIKPLGRPPPTNVLGRPPPPKVKTPEEKEKVSPPTRPTVIRKSKTEEVEDQAPLTSEEKVPEVPPVVERKNSPHSNSPADEGGNKVPPRPTSKPTTPVAPHRIIPEEKLTATDETEDVTEVKPTRPKAGPARPVSTPDKAQMESVKKPPKPQPPRPSVPKVEMAPELPSRPGPGHPLYHHMLSTPHGVATFEFPSSQKDELSFSEGEIIVLTRRVDDSWLAGKIGYKEGIFPQDFVQILVPLPEEYELQEEALVRELSVELDEDEVDFSDVPSNIEKKDWIGSGPRCCARFDFGGGGMGDLQFEEGDYIKLIGQEDEEWLQGELDGRVGIFPLSFVEIIEDLPSDFEDFSNQHEQHQSASPNLSRSTEDQVAPPGVGQPEPPFADNSQHQQAEFSCMALYDHEGRLGELSLKFGDYINVHSKLDDEWLFGEKDGLTGKFPIRCIDEVPVGLPSSHGKSPQRISPQDTSASTAGDSVCIALHDYGGSSPQDLSFKEGDSILLIEKLNDDWLKGKLNGKTGMFPSSFVSVKPSEPVTVKQADTVCGLALFDFDGQNDTELTFKAGDIIILGDVVPGAEDWRMGELGNHRGIFPASFVEEQTL